MKSWKREWKEEEENKRDGRQERRENYKHVGMLERKGLKDRGREGEGGERL